MLKNKNKINNTEPADNIPAPNQNILQADQEMLRCPISQQIFCVPVSLRGSGQIFEEEMAIQLLKSGNPICPVTRNIITGYDIAWTVKSMVDKFLEQNPEFKGEQYSVVRPLSNTSHDQMSNILNPRGYPAYLLFSSVTESSTSQFVTLPSAVLCAIPRNNSFRDTSFSARKSIYYHDFHCKTVLLGDSEVSKCNFMKALRMEHPYPEMMGEYSNSKMSIILSHDGVRVKYNVNNHPYHLLSHRRSRKYFKKARMFLFFGEVDRVRDWMERALGYASENASFLIIRYSYPVLKPYFHSLDRPENFNTPPSYIVSSVYDQHRHIPSTLLDNIFKCNWGRELRVGVQNELEEASTYDPRCVVM